MATESSHHTTTPLLAVLSPPSPASRATRAYPAAAAPRNSHARRPPSPRAAVQCTCDCPRSKTTCYATRTLLITQLRTKTTAWTHRVLARALVLL
ncbi:hypothetical protein RR46_01681 [Papilio xuthus]|uniref:Uncharacterized protein n=1 Tax=Papilio xuthus TaxID=66420 RepID=A0A0N1I4A6_PAPXU|nr:hypothetical protein RR46_01681 [Papilio xuthus]